LPKPDTALPITGVGLPIAGVGLFPMAGVGLPIAGAAMPAEGWIALGRHRITGREVLAGAPSPIQALLPENCR